MSKLFGTRLSIRYVCDKCGSQVFGTNVFKTHLVECGVLYNVQEHNVSIFEDDDDYDSDDLTPVPQAQYKYSCICCNFETNFKSHIRNHANSHDRMCPFCFSWQPGKTDLFRHLEDEHYDLQLQEINKVLDATNIGANVAQLGKQVSDLIERFSETICVDPCEDIYRGCASFSYLDHLNVVDDSLNSDRLVGSRSSSEFGGYEESDIDADITFNREITLPEVSSVEIECTQPMEEPPRLYISSANISKVIIDGILEDLLLRAVNIGICNEVFNQSFASSCSSFSPGDYRWEQNDSFNCSSESNTSHTLITLETTSLDSCEEEEEEDTQEIIFLGTEKESCNSRSKPLYSMKKENQREVTHMDSPLNLVTSHTRLKGIAKSGKEVDIVKVRGVPDKADDMLTDSASQADLSKSKSLTESKYENELTATSLVVSEETMKTESSSAMNSNSKVATKPKSRPPRSMRTTQPVSECSIEENMANLFREEASCDDVGSSQRDIHFEPSYFVVQKSTQKDKSVHSCPSQVSNETPTKLKIVNSAKSSRTINDQPENMSDQSSEYDEMKELEQFMKSHNMIPKKEKKGMKLNRRKKLQDQRKQNKIMKESQACYDNLKSSESDKDSQNFKIWLQKHEHLQKKDKQLITTERDKSKEKSQVAQKQKGKSDRHLDNEDSVKKRKPSSLRARKGSSNFKRPYVSPKKSKQNKTLSNINSTGGKDVNCSRLKNVVNQKDRNKRSSTSQRSDHDLPLKKRALVDSYLDYNLTTSSSIRKETSTKALDFERVKTSRRRIMNLKSKNALQVVFVPDNEVPHIVRLDSTKRNKL